MKITVIVSVIFVVVSCQKDEKSAPIVRHESEIHPDGSHNHIVETGNGIYEDRQGYKKDEKTHAIQGQYQYQSPEGYVIRVSYTADENGYQPQGDHLPTPPPIPPEILKALELLKTLPPRSDEN